ncbi:MAG: flagellar biosynthesis protein FlhF [bacterium]|nr:flagellar biosynthesis protein FlhF [bacterium]
MIIKKFEATTETEAMLLVKQELGKDAIIMNIKTISPKGVYRLFRKSSVEVTAALDDTVKEKPAAKPAFTTGFNPNYEQAKVRGDILKDLTAEEKTDSKEERSAIEEKLDKLQSLLVTQMEQNEKLAKETKVETDVFDIPCVKLIYDQLLENDVTKENAMSIIREVENRIEKDTSVDNVLSHIYQKIVLKLGQPKSIALEENETKFVFFIGPTGVGKTTTIAKIASSMKLQNKAKVALVTLDTYRIAAVDQLRTYANILSIPLKVVYSNEELLSLKDEFKDYDLVLVDTAGRSHKNQDQVADIKEMLDITSEDLREIYLVLSATTKYKDLLQIYETYKRLAGFNLIFTKLDETLAWGNILNIRMLTQAPLSYTTWGQNVPDDIGKINAQKIAKQLLGGNE